MKFISTAVIFMTIMAIAIHAQSTFDAASVRINHSGDGTSRRMEPGSITYLNITLGEFVQMAYGVKHYQLAGPDWIVNLASSDRYDVVAKSAGPASPDELRKMLGPMLAERFHLEVHRETRERPVYALVVGKNGAKLKPGDDGSPALHRDAAGGFEYKNYSMGLFADWLSMVPAMGRPVVDRTGLTGNFTFVANLYEAAPGVSPKRAMIESDDPGFTPLQEQLGLKLESRRAPIEMLVIDRAEKVPIEN
jgi:uncharacterized protein (TIGR03435 family)